MKTPDIKKFKRFMKKNEAHKTYTPTFCEDKEFCQGMHNMATLYKVSNPCSVCTQLVMEKLFQYEEAQEQAELEASTTHDEYLS